MTGLMEYCDGKCKEHCDEKAMEHSDDMCHGDLCRQVHEAM